ncbi:MAG: acetoin utilization protein [Alphaproteobacteria bacterium]|nr:MAG: acetoin utilization protein [Alphaproteobacteria bacterium]
MSTGLFYHADCQNHITPEGHPETSARLSVVLDCLDQPKFNDLIHIEARAAGKDKLSLVHSDEHIQNVMDHIPGSGHYSLDGDTHLSAGSANAALKAVGAVCQAIDEVMSGKLDNAFCAIRPPGHHAEPDKAMGFCLFNNVAIGALYARKSHFCHRVAIVDFDVHHGNGTQAVAMRHKGLFYGSTHQSPLYPGTGHLQDQGQGVIVNVPLAAGSGSRAFRLSCEGRIFPALEEFNPDFILLSAGFDAHTLDPLADLNLNEDDFHWVTREIKQIAEKQCKGRLVSCLEGGYNLNILGDSVAAHVSALMA